MDFKDKVILITGGASGIGKETAMQFAKKGAKVTIFDLNKKNLESTSAEVMKNSNSCLTFAGDVRKKGDIEKCVNATIEKFGDISCLVNCAGILKDGFIDKISEQVFDEVITVNLKGVFLSIQACVKKWIKEPKAIIQAAKKEGKPVPHPTTFPDRRIVNLSSMVAEGNIGQVAYSTSKAGIIGMTKTAAKELIQYNIRTHAIMPTLIDTPIFDKLFSIDNGKWRQYYESRIPLGLGKPRYITDVIMFLCSKESFFMNGAIIPVNGGRLESV
ncbi:MAG: SDR family NAD(P)-dependent oxidoreductase [Candidatus Bathyarchaeota archaeon]|nr:SDR family NAD(P)-dependent oxidoreductase [Candidatus Bathyarchaeota archaeon]